MSKRQKNKIIKLSKFFNYILGNRPYEFGLVPDKNGFVKIKQFLKAVTEEKGYGFVRQQHINEIIISDYATKIEISDNLIRTTAREKLSDSKTTSNLPKLLFSCVRNKAYPVVIEKGIRPMGRQHVILSSDRQMALRMGRRFDQSPVLLCVNTQQAKAKQIIFRHAGGSLYSTKFIPQNTFSGPPLPKDKNKDSLKKPDSQKTTPIYEPSGTFQIDLEELEKTPVKIKRSAKKKKIAWKTQRKQNKRKRGKMWDL